MSLVLICNPPSVITDMLLIKVEIANDDASLGTKLIGSYFIKSAYNQKKKKRQAGQWWTVICITGEKKIANDVCPIRTISSVFSGPRRASRFPCCLRRCSSISVTLLAGGRCTQIPAVLSQTTKPYSPFALRIFLRFHGHMGWH